MIALLWSARPELVRDIATTKTILQNTANPNVVLNPVQTCGGIPSSQIPNNTFGYGRVDALAAVNAAGQGTPTVTSVAGTATSLATSTAVASPTVCGAQPNWQAGPDQSPGRYTLQGAVASDGNFYVSAVRTQEISSSMISPVTTPPQTPGLPWALW